MLAENPLADPSMDFAQRISALEKVDLLQTARTQSIDFTSINDFSWPLLQVAPLQHRPLHLAQVPVSSEL